MSRIEYSWQVALQQSLLPLPRCTQATRISISSCQRSTGRSLRFWGLCTGASTPNTPYRLFQGRPVYHNSIFADSGSSALFPQMDVWHAAYALVLLEDRGQFATQKLYPSGERLPPSQGESPFPLDDYLSWMSPQRRCVCPPKEDGPFPETNLGVISSRVSRVSLRRPEESAGMEIRPRDTLPPNGPDAQEIRRQNFLSTYFCRRVSPPSTYAAVRQ
jgi:hypothetical protein